MIIFYKLIVLYGVQKFAGHEIVYKGQRYPVLPATPEEMLAQTQVEMFYFKAHHSSYKPILS